MTDSWYAKNAGAVFSLTYHLVWCPKYRRPVLVGPVDTRLKALLKDVASEHTMTLHTLELIPEIMPDHGYRFVEADPRFAFSTELSTPDR